MAEVAAFHLHEVLEFAEIEEDAAAAVALLDVNSVALIGAHESSALGALESGAGRVGVTGGRLGERHLVSVPCADKPTSAPQRSGDRGRGRGWWR